MSRANNILLIFLFLPLLWGCGKRRDATITPLPSPEQQLEMKVDSMLAAMSVEERVGQLFMPATYTTTDAPTIARLRKYVADAKIGGVVFLKGDTASMRALATELQGSARFPLFLAIDAEWGLGMRLIDARSYPHNSALKNASEAQMRDYGNQVGTDARTLGLNMLLAPVMDVATSPKSVMADRSFGADPQRVAMLGVAFAKGVNRNNVIPVAKHFPGHGATTTDSHNSLPLITRTADEFRAIDLMPFKRYAEHGLPAIMVGHIAVPALSGDSVPASISPRLLTELLRKEIGFKGLIITDAMNMRALPDADDIYVRSILAGADIILVPEDTRQAEQEIMTAIRSDRLPAAMLNDRVRRILRYKLKYASM